MCYKYVFFSGLPLCTFSGLHCPISHTVPNTCVSQEDTVTFRKPEEVSQNSGMLSMHSLTFNFVFVAAEQTEEEHD